MAEVSENTSIWEQSWNWGREGEEWSDWWGGSRPLWLGALLPRIDRFLPASTILEIAPGHGRWTQFLADHCDRLIGVDLAERCVTHCRDRFADSAHLEFHQTDGRSLEMVADASIDLAFSFDSLVHAESDVIDAYLGELSSKLRPDGVAFIHHSNLASYPRLTRLAKRVPPRHLPRLIKRGIIVDLIAWRAESVSAAGVAATAEQVGLVPISQELISWEHGAFLTDAITILTPRGSRWEAPPRRLRNPMFSAEGRRMRRLYSAGAAKSRSDS